MYISKKNTTFILIINDLKDSINICLSQVNLFQGIIKL
nr:MAG TPA: hypothetical protein [Caudoviricetes sp.]